MFFRQRATELEKIDLGPAHYTAEEYKRCLFQLGRIGRWLGSHQGHYAILDRLKPMSLLDIGCGGGQFTRLLAQRYPSAHILGVDSNAKSIEYACQQSMPSNLSFEVGSLAERGNKSVDVINATLLCHHLSDDELPQFLKEARRIARRAVVLNDLHRHVAAWLGFALIAPLLFPSRLIFHDGLLSIRKGFTRRDWNRILPEGKETEIQWHWPFRWMVTLHV